MKVTYYVDKRRKDREGRHAIYLRVVAEDKSIFLVSTSMSVKGDLIDGEYPRSETRANLKSSTLRLKKAKCEDYLYTHLDMDAAELKNQLTLLISDNSRGHQRKFGDYIDMYVREHEKLSIGTKKLYLQTKKIVNEYDSSATLDSITSKWLVGFMTHRIDMGKSVNGVGQTMRDIKAVFNYSIKKGYTRNYPFAGYTIPREKTRHRNLHVDLFRKVINYPCERFQVRYRDIFLLSFYLWGINFGDLLMMNKKDYHDGYIHYDRQKTGKAYMIKVEPEADAIIQRYKGKKRLLRFCESKEDYHQFLKQCNSQLKKIGMKFPPGKKPEGTALMPELSTYYARHSIATFAAEIGTPMSTISMGLGHAMSGGAVVTGTYVEFQQWMIDDCMRDVIDYIKSGKDARSYRMSKQVGNSDFADILKDIYAKLG